MVFLRAAIGLLLCLAQMSEASWAQAQDTRPQLAQAAPRSTNARPPTAAAVGEAEIASRANTWTLGLVAGLPEGTFLQFAADIARNLNGTDDLRVMPMVSGGSIDNVKDLLYLKGVDVAFTQTDVLEYFRTVEKISNIEKRVNYITGLWVSEVHLVVRPEINTISDLAGKKVSFNAPGGGASVTGPIVFQRVGVKVEPVYISTVIALEKMRTGEIAGFLHIGGKPIRPIASFKNDGGFKIIEIPLEKMTEFYVPGVLTTEDYPNLIKPGQKVETIGVPTALAVYNWPRSSDRLRRVSRFIDLLFDRFQRFKTPGYQPQWSHINLAGQVPGWTRYWVAEEKLKQMAAAQPPVSAPASPIDVQLARQQAARAAPGDAAEQERLFQRFLEWSKQQPKR